MKMKMIIDTDGVSDDMRAISLAIQHPNVELIAITTVHGCVTVEQATANVARLQRAHEHQNPIPIYMGNSEALIRKPFIAHPYFGIDGIGDDPNVFPEVSLEDFSAHESETAVLAMLRLIKEHDDVTLVCIGPLTNIALAYKIDRSFAGRLKKLVVLGGNYFGVGNTNDGSSKEFNFGSDPEAAKIVMEEMSTPITMVPWEVHYLKGAEHEEEVDFDAHLKHGTPLADFLALVSRTGRTVMANYSRQYGYCDEIAVAVAIDENAIVKKAMDLRIGIETSGQMTRGQVVVDWNGVLFGRDGSITEAEIAGEVDRSRPTVQVVVDYHVKTLDKWMHNTVLGVNANW